MKHVVAIWGTTLQTDEELQPFLQPEYTEDGDVIPSGFMAAAGLDWVDEDFFEVHAVAQVEERAAFLAYLQRECVSAGESFAEKIPPNLSGEIARFPTVILLYGQVTNYGTVNEALFALTGEQHVGDGLVELLATIEYEE